MIAFVPYSFILFLHVGSAIVLIGHSIGALLVQTRIRGARSAQALQAWLAFARDSARWNPAAALVLLGSGLYLGSTGWWQAAWFQVALLAWLVNAVLAARVIKPAAQSIGAALAQMGAAPVPAAFERLHRAGEVATRVMLANDVAILYAMIAKPTLTEVLVLVGLAQLALALRGRAGRRLTAPGSRAAASRVA